MDSIYLDHAAATPLRAEVAVAMEEAAAKAFGNPSSQHALGRLAKRFLEDAREQIMELVGGRAAGAVRDRLVFTSGATEANRMAMLGLANEGCRVAVSSRDHPSIASAAAELAQRGHSVRTLPLEPDGTIVAAALADAIADASGTSLLVAVTPVCGQTGLRDTISAAWCRPDSSLSFTVTIHADATQAAAWEALEFARSPYATMTLASHKFGGPRGIGGLLVRGDMPHLSLTPLLPGAQELGLRGGTEAVSLAVGFARALELVAAERDHVSRRVESLRKQFEEGLVTAARDAGLDALVIGQNAPRAPHIAAVSIPGIARQTLVIAADLEGVCLSAGTACASGSSEPPPVLCGLRLDDAVVAGTFRASLGRSTTQADVDEALARLRQVLARVPR